MIDIEKFICSLLADHPVGVTVREDIHKALKDQGLEYEGGKIVPIEGKTALQESEDERIRKYLSSFVELNSGVNLPPEDAKKILAWIEKQGEHANFRNKIQVGDKVTRNKDGVLVNLSQLNRVAKKDNKQGEKIDLVNKEYWRGYREGKQEILDKYSELEKQGGKGVKGNEREIPLSEQKPTDKIEPKFKVGDNIISTLSNNPYYITEVCNGYYLTDIGCIIMFNAQDNFEPLEQKPAWSEEDERMFNSALWHVKNSCGNGGKNSGEFEVYNWLKSLKERVQLQNSSVTDEELAQAKKDAYNNALDKIEYHSGEPTFDDGWSAAIWYLKKRNAQPQDNWRPSDEQMKALGIAIRCGIQLGTWEEIALKDLKEHLKKLRKE